MRSALGFFGFVTGVALGLPVYLVLLPSSPALGAIILGGLAFGLPASLRNAYDKAAYRELDFDPELW